MVTEGAVVSLRNDSGKCKVGDPLGAGPGFLSPFYGQQCLFITKYIAQVFRLD